MMTTSSPPRSCWERAGLARLLEALWEEPGPEDAFQASSLSSLPVSPEAQSQAWMSSVRQRDKDLSGEWTTLCNLARSA